MRNYLIVILLILVCFSVAAQEGQTVKPKITKQWALSSDYSEVIPVKFDTVFSLFHRFKVADKYSPVNASLGNYGLPFYQVNFFDRVRDPDKFLYQNYYPFMHLPDNAVFMDTQRPFTELKWTFAGPKETSEQTFRIMHTQNVNKDFNFGFIYDIIYSRGQYRYQRSEDKTFTFFSSYTKSKYKMYFAAGLNNITSKENGGIPDKDDLDVPNPQDVKVNLEGQIHKAESFLKNRNLLLVQKYSIGNNTSNSDSTSVEKKGFFGLSGTFSHIFILESNRRTYYDESPLSEFYDSVYINTAITFDSLYSRVIRNTLRFDFQTDESRKFRLGGGFGLRHEAFKYSQIRPADSSIIADTIPHSKDNFVLVGRLFNNIGDKFYWEATGEYFLTGYRNGDIDIKGKIVKSFNTKKGDAVWELSGGFSKTKPSYWYQHWGSNNFIWDQSLAREIRLDLGSSVDFPERGAKIKFNYAVIDNYTDFDTAAIPSQNKGGFNIAALTVSKSMKAWKFHLDTDIIIQKSGNEGVLDLPLLTIRSAGYFEHLFRFKSTGGQLNTQLGADVTYHTPYYAYSYMPATGRFYRQEREETGGYPFVNVFFNFKVQRTRVFLMFDHVNYGLMGNKIAYNYEMVPFYPMNIRMFRYGIAWTFYN